MVILWRLIYLILQDLIPQPVFDAHHGGKACMDGSIPGITWEGFGMKIQPNTKGLLPSYGEVFAQTVTVKYNTLPYLC